MKSYLTEAEATATTSQPTSSTTRQPFKLLQNLQQCHISIFSKMASSSALKSVTNRQRRTDSSAPQRNSKIFESSNSTTPKNKVSNVTPRQKNILNTRTVTKPANSDLKKQDAPSATKTETSSSTTTNSVGSLTSSPKWSHIKNKFENGSSVEKTKLSKTTSLNSEGNDSSKIQNCESKSMNSLLVPDSKVSVAKNGITVKKNDKDVLPKSESRATVSKLKTIDDKSKLEIGKGAKGITQRDRSSSPKNSYANIPKSNATNCKSSKNSSLNIPVTKSSSQFLSNSTRSSQLCKSLGNSSVSLSSNSSKNSEADDTNSVSSSISCNSKNSLLNIPSGSNSRSSSPKSSSSNIPRSSSPKSSQSNILSANVSALHSGLAAKRNTQVNKITYSAGNKKTESKPKGNVTQSSSLLSEKDRLLLNSVSYINKTCRISSTNKQNESSILGGATNKSSAADHAEKIQDLVRNSQSSSKTVWVKDSAGNWIKRADTESKTTVQSKVACLRSKFLENDKETALPLTKSVTSSNVPAKLSQSRPLAKSSTTSSICEKTFMDDLTQKGKGGSNKQSENGKSEVENSNVTSQNSHHKRNSVDSDAKLNIVQRAILSYEGNLTLLSPETQRRLKLVNDKVKAQTDDDKILKSKTQDSETKRTKSTAPGESKNSKKVSSQKTVGEPLLPTRDFLSRYQLMNKDLKRNSSPPQEASFPKPVEQKVNLASKSISRSNELDGSKITKTLTDKIAPLNSNSNFNKVEISSLGQKSQQNLILNLSENHLSVKTSESQGGSNVLLPNSSFLWRRSTTASSELSKSSTTSSVSLTSSDYRNYYDAQNYYSTLDLEIEKRSEIPDEPIYIESQDSNSSENYYSTDSGPYQNIAENKKDTIGEWTDFSDDDNVRNSLPSNQSSTLKKKRNKRHTNQKNSQNLQKNQYSSEAKKKQQLNDTISFTDSSDTLINDEIENESTFEMSDSNHFYEPVYESLGNYLLNQDDQEDENCSLSLSPDDREDRDFLQCSLSSLESAESAKQEKEENYASSKNSDKSNEDKKSSNKISQLRRHLSWTKNDIRLELSSKFNKIKIKKNGQNSTHIGVKVQEHDSVNTSPKKKTFIKCILRQKSASSIPVKRSPSPKKESALFYVHLSMGQEKQRPVSDSVVASNTTKTIEESVLNKSKKTSETSIQVNSKCGQQRPRFRKVTGPTVQRPKTPPPLPPTVNHISTNKGTSEDTSNGLSGDNESHFYTCLDPDYFQLGNGNESVNYEDIFPSVLNSRFHDSASKEDLTKENKSKTEKSKACYSIKSDDLNLPPFPTFQSELLKSPFEEEPMYQFYQKDVQQRATLWYSAEGSESDFEDDASSKFSDTDSQPMAKPPVLQSQMSAMDLVHGEGGQRTLWCEVPEVVESGILKTISSKDRKIQEAMFEVITSEASYLKSLNFLFEHFVQCPEFSGSETNILDKREKHVLFSDIQPVRDVSARLLADLEKRWLENILLSNICDIIYEHASKYFSVYIKYCSNQLYQERLLRELKEKRPEFVAVLKKLESNAVCQGLDMHSFLMLPMQRITRLPLLIDAIFHRLSPDSPIYESCKMALATLNKLVAECNEGARKMERMEEMLVISQQLDFKDCKGLGLLSASRWLVKKGELVQLLLDNSSRRTFGRSSRWCKIQLYLFLFTDLLVVTRKKSDDSYSVVDFCPRNMLQVLSVDETMPPLPMRLPSNYRNLFQMIMLNNKDGKTVEMLLSCLLESDRTRWMDAMTPAKSENPDEKIYEEWDWPQFQCTHAYNAQQPDELSLEEADVVNVFRKMSDGWFEGERIRDGVRGWFPSSHAVEIITQHVRARNLRQRYRLLMLSQTYLEEQYKAQAMQAKK
ncbi:Rho guanine nucleotide exchange factor 16 like protein [Argiope bruennichi]|uniref:Rho guanine nucleotide exchange factor 16 like protein n=1 Tax=Argiope bruennichi TaxID=94029 RepID=A0A8T0EGB0_ARGBR|nr:Rho guanine nucleotide exchange factor 16 like protein [Argiope bruennichi]